MSFDDYVLVCAGPACDASDCPKDDCLVLRVVMGWPEMQGDEGKSLSSALVERLTWFTTPEGKWHAERVRRGEAGL